MVAVRLLCDEGYVTSKPNTGNYVRDRTNHVDPAQELRLLRAQLGELGTQVRQVRANLAAIDARLFALSEVVARVEELNKRPGEQAG